MRLLAAVVLGLVGIGCSAAPANEEAASDSDEANLTTRALDFRLSIAKQGDAIELDDVPRLNAAATAKLVCTGKFEGVAGARWSCTRGSERLEFLNRPATHDATLLYKNGSAARETIACTKSGASGLACKTAEKRPSSGGLTSPFASTVAGISIPNAHAIDGSPLLLRGMAPRGDAQFAELEAAGVDAVLIFKNATGQGNDVEDERTELVSRGFPASRIEHVPFRWKDIPSFKEACEQTVDALSFLAKQEAARKKTFFHCTVGEDRTGTLAALARLVRAPSTSPSELFQLEMCERGYAQGNPQKPSMVTHSLDEELTPVYRKIAYLVRSGAISKDNLDASACAHDPSGSADFERDAELEPSRFHCGTSTAY